jgi:PST family polysaccharide transporter
MLSGERRRILENFAWLISDRAGRVVVNLVVSVFVARSLGPTEFGMLSFATVLSGLFAVLSGLGLENVVVRDLARGDERGAWKAAWRLRLGASVVAYVLTVAAAYAWRPDSPRLCGVVAIVAAGLLFTPADLFDAWFQSQGRMRPPAVARQLALWMAVAWRMVLVATDASLESFALANVAEAAAVALALRWTFKKEETPVAAPGQIGAQMRRLLREGWPLLASGVLVTITMQSDRLLLGHIRGDAELGIYVVASRFTEIFHILPVAVGAAAMPRLTTLYRDDQSRYWAFARGAVAAAALTGFAVGAVLAGIGPFILTTVFGSEYEGASDILAAHAWTLVFIFIVSLRSRLLVIEAGTRWVLAMSLLTAALNVAGNLLLIPRFGGVGAAWTAVGAWAFSALVAPLCFAHTRTLLVKLVRGTAAR